MGNLYKPEWKATVMINDVENNNNHNSIVNVYVCTSYSKLNHKSLSQIENVLLIVSLKIHLQKEINK